MASDLLNHPGAPIHEACSDWSEAKGTYRLFDNDKLNDDFLMNAHRNETLKRMAESNNDVILAVQDTTTLTYTHHPKKQGIHKINQNPGFDKPSKGFFSSQHVSNDRRCYPSRTPRSKDIST